MTRGATPAELIISVAIVVGIAAAMTPVVRNLKHSGQVKESLGRLTTLHKQISLYRSDWDSSGYGTLAEAGSPAVLMSPSQVWDCPMSSGCPPAGKTPLLLNRFVPMTTGQTPGVTTTSTTQ